MAARPRARRVNSVNGKALRGDETREIASAGQRQA
jgi:hypothetical protein